MLTNQKYSSPIAKDRSVAINIENLSKQHHLVNEAVRVTVQIWGFRRLVHYATNQSSVR